MQEILRYTHQFLQKFCAGNPGNQALLHKHLQLFLTPGVRHAQTRGAPTQGPGWAPPFSDGPPLPPTAPGGRDHAAHFP